MAYGPQNRTQQRRQTRLALAEAQRGEVWKRPPEVEWDEHPAYEAVLLENPGHVLIIRSAFWRGKYVDYSIVDEFRDQSAHPCVARADTSKKHDSAHYHVCSRRDGSDIKYEDLQFIASQDDLNNSYNDAYNVIVGNIESHEKMWRNG